MGEAQLECGQDCTPENSNKLGWHGGSRWAIRYRNLSQLERITFGPQIMAGQTCIRGMRIPVSLILNLVANGMTVCDIIADYPYLEPEDIQQSLQYAAWLTQDRVYFWQPAKAG